MSEEDRVRESARRMAESGMAPEEIAVAIWQALRESIWGRGPRRHRAGLEPLETAQAP
jgi:hypothetical protein